METQIPQIAKSCKGRTEMEVYTTGLQTILRRYSNQNSMILEQEQTHRSMEPNRDPRHIPKLIRSINLCQKRQEHTIGKIQPPQ